jgi:glycosyltransferase involved in cell wall biosynthesis
MRTPLISVIITNYNYGRYLRQAIDSALAQTYPSVEVIVVDDGSQDDSADVARSYGERVRFIAQKNQGVSVARNRGVEESSGEFVAFLDADDIWFPYKLEKQAGRLLSDPELGLVHCGIQEIDGDGARLDKVIQGMEGWVAKEMLLFERPVIHSLGSTGLIRRIAFDSVGGFDPDLSTSADWDFCYQVALRQRIGFIAEPLVYYRVHSSNMHSNIKLMEHDVMICYRKAFDTTDPALLAIRRRSYGNIHMVLAGSYFQSGNAMAFLRHTLRSVLYSPSCFKRVLGFPVRWWRRTMHVKPLSNPQGLTSVRAARAVQGGLSTQAKLSTTKRQISVVVPVRNEAKNIEKLICALQEQTYQPAEIVITDGGSVDGTQQILRRMQSESPVPIILIEDADAFPGRGRNLGVKQASNEWLAFIDGGIVPEQNWLEELVSVSEHDPDSVLIQGRFEPQIDTYFAQCAAIAYVAPPGTLTPFIASSLIKRSAWESAGGFREDLRSAEDLIFFRKLKNVGILRSVSEKAVVYWELQPDFTSTFRRFSTYSRYGMQAGLVGDWQLRVSFLYFCFAIFFIASLVSWPFALLPPLGLILRAERRIFNWYSTETKRRQILEMLNPRRVLTVTLISFVIDLAMFCGMVEFFRKERFSSRKLNQHPNEIRS